MKRLLLLFTFCSLLFNECALIYPDTDYNAYVNWHITIINNRSFPITTFAIHALSEDTYSSVERLDNYGINPTIISQSSDSTILLKVCVGSFCFEPIVESENDFLFKISVDSNHVSTDPIQINLFPYPDYKDYVLCSDYYQNSESGTSFSCTNDFYDTIHISLDTVESTINYMYWRKVPH
jgi:hypothetical protein